MRAPPLATERRRAATISVYVSSLVAERRQGTGQMSSRAAFDNQALLILIRTQCDVTVQSRYHQTRLIFLTLRILTTLHVIRESDPTAASALLWSLTPSTMRFDPRYDTNEIESALDQSYNATHCDSVPQAYRPRPFCH